MKTLQLTIPDIEAAIDLPVEKWVRKCYGVAKACVDKGLMPEGSEPAYGVWRGPVHSNSVFFDRSVVFGRVRHGWVVLPDETIFDPTQWTLSQPGEPFLFQGTSLQYSEAAGLLALDVPDPPPAQGQQLNLHGLLDPDLASRVASLLRAEPPWTAKQVFWLANLPLSALDHDAPALYAAFKALGLLEFVPFDNRTRAARLVRKGLL